MQQEEKLEDILKDLLPKDQLALDTWIQATTESDINKKDKDGKTLLILLAEKTNRTKEEKTLFATLLSTKKTDVNVIDNAGKSALLYSSIVTILDHVSYKVNVVYPDGSTDFTWAIKHNEHDIIVKLLEKSELDVSACMIDNLPLFSFLVKKEKLWVIHNIFQHPNFNKEYLNICDSNEGRTVLHYACLPVIKIPALTPPQPSNPICPNCHKFTPQVHYAGSVSQFTQQQFQMRKNNFEKVIVEVLRYENMDINQQDKDGYTALMYAVKSQPPRVIQAFLNHPTTCDFTLKNVYNQTVYDIVNDAISDVDTRIVSLIKSKWDELPQHKEDNFLSNMSLSKQVELLRRKLDSLEISKSQTKNLLQQLDCFESDAKLYIEGKDSNEGGGMSSLDRQKLLARRVYICENLSPIDVLDYLIQDDIITEDCVEAIKLNRTRREMTVKLLSILPNSGPDAFECFLNALFSTKQEYIAKELIDCNPY